MLPGAGRGRERAFRAIRAFRPAGMRRAGALDLLLRAGASKESPPGPSCGRRQGDILRPTGAGTADRPMPARRRSASSPTRPCLKMMGDGPALRHTARDRLPQVQLVAEGGREDLRERARPRLRRRRPVAEDGHRRHRVQVLVRQGLPRADLRLRQRGNRRLVDIRVAEHGAAGRDPRHAHPPGARWRAIR